MKILLLIFFFLANQGFSWTTLSNATKGWNKKSIEIGVNITHCTISDNEILSIIDEAIAAWNGIPNSSLTLSRKDSSTTVAEILAGTATDSPVIICDPNFGTSVGVSGIENSSPGVTLTPSIGTDGYITYANMLLNAQTGAGAEIATLSHGKMVIVVAHELGHALGLGHTSDSKALMYYSISSKTDAYISEDDMDGISFLYPRNEFSDKPMGCSAVHSPNPVSRKELAQAMGLILLFTFGTMFFCRKILKT